MIRVSGIVVMLIVVGGVLAAFRGGKSTPKATSTSDLSRTPGAAVAMQDGAAASQGGTAQATGSPAAANPTWADAATGASGTPSGGYTAPVSASGTPSYIFSTPPAGDAATPGAPTPGASTATVVTGGPAGGAIMVAPASLVGGKVEVPVQVAGTGIASFTGFSIHVRWNASIFKFDSARSTGTVLPGSVFCPAATVDADGAGAILPCTALSGAETTSAGLLGTIVLTPVGTGCSPLHLFTYQGADAGDGGTGTYTMNKAAAVVLTVTTDGSVDQAGQHC
jgi:hypothetical protein